MSESWYVVQDGAAQGPFDAAAMAAKVADGTVRADSQACRVGAQTWGRADEDEALRALFAAGAPIAPQAPAWSIGLGFSMLKAWKGPCWGAMVLIGLTWFALMLPDIVIDAVVDGMKESQSGKVEPIVAASAALLSLLTRVFVHIPVQSAIAVMGASAIAGNLRVADMFMAYRRFFGVLGATIVYGAGFALVSIVFLLLGMLAPFLSSVARGNGGLIIAVIAVVAILVIVFLIWFVRRAIRYSFGIAIVCDPANRSLGIFEAFRRSAEALKGKEGSVLGFLLLVGLLAALTSLLLGVGLLLIGWPLLMCAQGAVYRVLVRGQVAPAPSAASPGA